MKRTTFFALLISGLQLCLFTITSHAQELAPARWQANVNLGYGKAFNENMIMAGAEAGWYFKPYIALLGNAEIGYTTN